MYFHEVMRLFDQIEKASDIDEKKELITKGKDDELFIKIMSFLIDDDIKPSVTSELMWKKVDQSVIIIPLHEIVDAMNYVSVFYDNTELLKIVTIREFVSKMRDIWGIKDAMFFEKILTKTMNVGCPKEVVYECIPNIDRKYDNSGSVWRIH